MKIHSDALDTTEIRKAARRAGVSFTRFDLGNSRSRAQRFDIILTGSSSRRQNFGGEDMAATWDEWGIFLGILFALDPQARSDHYESLDHFTWATGGRFADGSLTRLTQHATHRWEHSGAVVTNSYYVSECQCGAIRRFLRGRTWAEFVAANE
jgi:hypothetical protein